MTAITNRKSGRPTGSLAQKTLIKSSANEARAFLNNLIRSPDTSTEVRIQAADVILSHCAQTCSSEAIK